MSGRRFALRVTAALGAAFCLPAVAQADLLPAAEAFQIRRAVRQGDWIDVELWAAPGYAVYAERIRFQPDSTAVKVASVELPKGVSKWDEALGERLTYLRGTVYARVKLAGPAPAARLTVVVQGCADAGVCYPPVARTFDVGRLS